MNTSPAHLFTGDFLKAVKDYLWLLEKGYPQKLILKMTGDRYALSGIQRIMLYRGITTASTSLSRIPKLLHEDLLRDQILHVDTLNVLITVGSYLSGRTVFISTDSILRDASGVHGKRIEKDLLQKAVVMSLAYLDSLSVKEIVFYVDEQVDDSGFIHEAITHQLREMDARGTALLCKKVDSTLTGILAGIIATSDSAIVDHAAVPVFDLPHHMLLKNFHPRFPDLRLLIA